MGQDACEQTVVSLLIVEFHVLEQHLAWLKPECVTFDLEGGVYGLLYKNTVFQNGFAFHIQTGQIAEQT